MPIISITAGVLGSPSRSYGDESLARHRRIQLPSPRRLRNSHENRRLVSLDGFDENSLGAKGSSGRLPE
jgi:hypothetical protein